MAEEWADTVAEEWADTVAKEAVNVTQKKVFRIFFYIVFGFISFLAIFWITFALMDRSLQSRSQVFKLYNGSFELGEGDYPLPAAFSNEQINRDLDAMVQIMAEVHPLFETQDKLKSLQKAATDLKEKLLIASIQSGKNLLTRTQVFFEFSQLAASVADAHTYLRFQSPYKDDTRILRLPLVFKWLYDGMVVDGFISMENSYRVQIGDKLVEIGELTTDQFFRKMKPVTSAENDEWVKYRLADTLPYYYLHDYLKTSIAGDASEVPPTGSDNRVSTYVPLTFLNPSGETFTENIPFVLLEYSNYLKNTRNWYGWYIEEENSLGVFWLDACEVTTGYIQSVEVFFDEVYRKKVQTVVIDLRENTGGDSTAADIFLKYLPKEKIKDFDAYIRASAAVLKIRALTAFNRFTRMIGKAFSQGTKVVSRPADSDRIFQGNVFLLTSKQTFSSANYFAVLLRDNALAKTVGEKTGNAPSAYGDVLLFMLPETKFQFVISFKKFNRPDQTLSNQEALEPDIFIPFTAKNYQTQTDPLLDWIRENHPNELQ